MKTNIIRFVLAAAPMIIVGSLALANSGHGANFNEKKPLAPATRYSGRAPVDLNNGIPFNNGTFGMPNMNYERWAEGPFVVPGVADMPYPFSWKADFIGGLEESARFVEDAITNWKIVTPITKPEAKEYGEKSAAAMEPLLNRFKDVIRQTASASKTDWDKSQADARRALVELRATYSSLHKNTH